MPHPREDAQSTGLYFGVVRRWAAGPLRVSSSHGQPSSPQTGAGPSRSPAAASSRQPDSRRETGPDNAQRDQGREYISSRPRWFSSGKRGAETTYHDSLACSHEDFSAEASVTRRPRSSCSSDVETTYHDSLACSHEDFSAAASVTRRPRSSCSSDVETTYHDSAHAPTRNSPPPLVLRGGTRHVAFADLSSKSADTKHHHVPPAAAGPRHPRMPPPGFVIGEVDE
ncbi:hypothetical protein MY4038_004527 [Beauveria bassiana]